MVLLQSLRAAHTTRTLLVSGPPWSQRHISFYSRWLCSASIVKGDAGWWWSKQVLFMFEFTHSSDFRAHEVCVYVRVYLKVYRRQRCGKYRWVLPIETLLQACTLRGMLYKLDFECHFLPLIVCDIPHGRIFWFCI